MSSRKKERSKRIRKYKYYFKRWWKITKRDTLSPIFNNGHLFQLTTIAVLILIFDPLEGEIEFLAKEKISWLAAIPAWFVINMVLAPLRLRNEEKKEGHWQDYKFVYHVPKHVYTTSVNGSDIDRVEKFIVTNAEPESFVGFKNEYEGGLGRSEIVQHENNAFILRGVNRDSQFGAKIGKDKSIKLVTKCPPDSASTIVRVSMLYWELN